MFFFDTRLFHSFSDLQLEGCQVLRTSSEILAPARCSFSGTESVRAKQRLTAL